MAVTCTEALCLLIRTLPCAIIGYNVDSVDQNKPSHATSHNLVNIIDYR